MSAASHHPTAVPAEIRASTRVIVPAFHEEQAIGAVVEELAERWPVVVVDDGSRDATAEEARVAGAEVLRHPINRGQGAALQTGIDWSLERGARFLVTFDADGQHREADIERLLQPLLTQRAEVALGSRFLGRTVGLPASRRLVLKAAVLFTRWSSGLRLSDTHNGLRAFTRQAARRIRITLDRMAHASELLDQIRRHRLSYEEVPVEIAYTPYSAAKGQGNLAAAKILADYLLNRVLR